MKYWQQRRYRYFERGDPTKIFTGFLCAREEMQGTVVKSKKSNETGAPSGQSRMRAGAIQEYKPGWHILVAPVV